MPRSLLYTALTLVVAVAGVANRRRAPDSLPSELLPTDHETRLANCEEAIVTARRSPYWQNQSFAVDCRPAPGGWRLTAIAANSEQACELYVGRDRLIMPHLPCQGVGRF